MRPVSFAHCKARMRLRATAWHLAAAVVLLFATQASSIRAAAVVGQAAARMLEETPVGLCNTQLMAYLNSSARCQGNGDGTADLLRYLARNYATCLENATTTPGPPIVQIMAPSSIVANVAELALASPQMPNSIGPNLLFFAVDTAHITLEALLELSTNVDTVSAGWLLPAWGYDRLRLAQTVVSIDQVISPPLLSAIRAALTTGSVQFNTTTTTDTTTSSSLPPPPAVAATPDASSSDSSATPSASAEGNSAAAQHTHVLLEGIPEYFHHLATAGTDHANFIPVEGAVNLLYYRRDILASKGWQPPATWQQLITMAAALNGTDLNEDGQPDYGFCIEQDAECQYTTLVAAVLTSMTQYDGPAQGALLDVKTLMPVFNTTAFVETMGVLTQLASLSPAIEDTSFADINNLAAALQVLSLNGKNEEVVVLVKNTLLGANTRDTHCMGATTLNFHKGRCAFTIGSGRTWKAVQLTTNATIYNTPFSAPAGNPTNSTATSNATAPTNSTVNATLPGVPWYAKGRMGFAMLPGHTRVLNRTTNELMDCTETLCPNGINNAPEPILGDDGQTVLYVNRAPYQPTPGLSGAVSSAGSQSAQTAAGVLWLVVASAHVHNQLALSPRALNILPMRTEMLDPSALPQYVQAGFDQGDTTAYLAAVTTTLTHHNPVPCAAIPGVHIIRRNMNAAMMAAVRGQNPRAVGQAIQDDIMIQVLFYSDPGNTGTPTAAWQQLQAACTQALGAPPQDLDDYRTTLLNTYRFSTGYYGWDRKQETPSNNLGSMPTVSLVVPITCTVLVLTLSLLYELRKHIEHRKLFGKVVAPGPYKETTLLVTDIEASTTLWELLPPHVMDITLHEHHACIRQLLLKHCGYESATEGDSFILAFHCPEDALLFAMECQVALLECAWPPELLECEQCAPYYVVQVETGSNKLVPLGLDPLDEDALLVDRLNDRNNSTSLEPPALPSRYSSDSQAKAVWHQLPDGSVMPAPERPRPAVVMGRLFDRLVGRAEPPPALLPQARSGQLSVDGTETPGGTGGPNSTTHSRQQTSAGGPLTLTNQGGSGQLHVPFASQGSIQPITQLGSQLRQPGSHDPSQPTTAGTESLVHKAGLSHGMTQGGMSIASSPQSERTFLTEVQASWQPATASTPNAVLIFRGLRVRMGMTSGVGSDADVTYNKAAARAHYSGEIMVMAKAVSDAAAGGSVLLSESSFSLLPLESLWDKALVMHVGEYVLNDTLPQMDLYQVAGRRLLGRIAHLSVSRCKAVISRGVLSAPLGNVAIVHAQAVGAMTLMAWNEAATLEALDTFKAEAMQAMAHLNGGYVADVQSDQIIVVFPLAAEAIVWGLNLHKAMLEAEWPPELFEHELCEELTVNGVVVFRGLRVKVGLDSGEVVGEVNSLTGRCVYRGRAVTRSLRIMQMATSNQVLCTSHAWAAANTPAGTAVLAPHSVSAERLGPFKLKGLMEKAELLQCRFATKPLVNKRRASTLMPAYFDPAAAGLLGLGSDGFSLPDAEGQIPTAPSHDP